MILPFPSRPGGRSLFLTLVIGLPALCLPVAANAVPVYWNVFNIEGENAQGAAFVTYGSLTDMLHDQNRIDAVFPDGPGASERNIIGSGSDGTTFWNVFNIEGENSQGAAFVTYASLTDMLFDQNRIDAVFPDGPGASERNIIGSGSDGTTYWNVFNIEGENTQGAAFVTYASLTDMLHDQNRLDAVFPDGPGGSERNIIGSGSDGTTYWNLFNIEGENTQGAAFVTYASLTDMLHDQNRLDAVFPDGPGASERNIVGTGAFVMRGGGPVPVSEPPILLLLLTALLVYVSPKRMRPGVARRH